MNENTDGPALRAFGYKCSSGCTCGRHHRSNRNGYQQSGMKYCPKCRETRPLADFDVHHQGKVGLVYHARCKPCRRDDARENNRRRTLSKAYGLTTAQYDGLFAEQGGVCAICGKPESARRIRTIRPLSVDHDHLTGEIRGLLCSGCNRAIGLMGDDINILKRAVNYLQSGAEYPA